MRLAPQGGREESALPGLHHWIIATVMLSVTILVVPVIAGLV